MKVGVMNLSCATSKLQSRCGAPGTPSIWNETGTIGAFAVSETTMDACRSLTRAPSGRTAMPSLKEAASLAKNQSTRPIAVIDPDNRNFSYQPTLMFNAGGGLRIYFNRWLSATAEIRDYIFNDKLENLQIARSLNEQQNEDTWYGEEKLTNNVQAQLGVSIFIPFSFEYTLPK